LTFVYIFLSFNSPAPAEIYTLSLHDALPISPSFPVGFYKIIDAPVGRGAYVSFCPPPAKVFDIAMARQTIDTGNCPGGYGMLLKDRKSTRLNSSHVKISYAVFCLKKKKIDKK